MRREGPLRCRRPDYGRVWPLSKNSRVKSSSEKFVKSRCAGPGPGPGYHLSQELLHALRRLLACCWCPTNGRRSSAPRCGLTRRATRASSRWTAAPSTTVRRHPAAALTLTLTQHEHQHQPVMYQHQPAMLPPGCCPHPTPTPSATPHTEHPHRASTPSTQSPPATTSPCAEQGPRPGCCRATRLRLSHGGCARRWPSLRASESTTLCCAGTVAPLAGTSVTYSATCGSFCRSREPQRGRRAARWWRILWSYACRMRFLS